MTDFMKETSGTSIAFHFLHSRYVKKPSFKLLLFFSSFSVNRLYSLKHEIFNWIHQELISGFGLFNSSLLQLLKWGSSILIRRPCHLNCMSFLLPELITRKSDKELGTSTCTNKYWCYCSKQCKQNSAPADIWRNKSKIIHIFLVNMKILSKQMFVCSSIDW